MNTTVRRRSDEMPPAVSDQDTAGHNAFVRKMASFAALSPGDVTALNASLVGIRDVDRDEVIVAEGAAPQCAVVVLEGIACRYKHLPDGGRQILDFLLPGDLCAEHAGFLAEMDHTVAGLSGCRIACIPNAEIIRLAEARPAVARAFSSSRLVQENIAREWMANIGRRSAVKRMAHLLCELCFRFDEVGLACGGRYDLPIVQNDLADATGLSVVHANRTLQKLRALGLIVLKRNLLEVHDIDALRAFCGFDEAYLHLWR